MKRIIAAIAAAALTGMIRGQPAQPAYPLSVYRAFGSSLGQSAQLSSLGWSEAQFEAFADGMREAFRGHPVQMDEAASRFAAETSQRIAAIGAGAAPAAASAPAPAPDPAAVERFMHQARQRFGLQVSDSGLCYNVQPGNNGVRPRPGDTVVFSCTVRGAANQPVPLLGGEHLRSTFDGLLPGLAAGLQLMTVGGRAFLLLPPALSFGSGDWPDGVPRGTPLLYQITLEQVIPRR